MCKTLFITLLFVVLCYVKCQTESSVQISLAAFDPDRDEVMYENIISLPPNSLTPINFINAPEYPSFIIVQTHSYRLPVTLSELPKLQSKHYINGTNIGLHYAFPNSNPSFYVSNPNPTSLSVLIVVSMYPSDAPVPGGANMEFSTPVAPYLQLQLTENVINVDAQPASLINGEGLIEYEMYHFYLPEWDFDENGYFVGLKHLINSSNARAFGRKVSAPLYGPELRRTYSAYLGIGQIFSVVATHGNRSAVYVPAVTYACPINQTDDTCEEITSSNVQILLGIVFFAGLFLCVKGQAFFKTGMFLHALFFGFVVSFVVIDIYGHTSFEENVFSAVLVGTAFALFWIAVWIYFGVPILSVFVPNSNLGFLFASIIFYSGAGDVRIMQIEINFWLLVITVLFATSVFVPVAAKHQGNILTSSLFGSFCTALTLSHFAGAYFHYTFVNIIRRVTDPDFQTAVIDPPFQSIDWIVIISWGFIFVFGYYFQCADQRGKPPFPPPPYDRNNCGSLFRSEREPLISPMLRNTVTRQSATMYSSTG